MRDTGNETVDDEQLEKCMFCGEKKPKTEKVGKKNICPDCVKDLQKVT